MKAKIFLARLNNKVMMQVLEMDESLRGKGDLCKYSKDNTFIIKSEKSPEIYSNEYESHI